MGERVLALAIERECPAYCEVSAQLAEPLVEFRIAIFFVDSGGADVGDAVSLGGVYIKNPFDQFGGLHGNEGGYLVVTRLDLGVENVGVGVLKGEVAADQRIKNYAEAPNIHLERRVGLPQNHLRSRVAGRAACRFQQLSWLRQVRQAKVHDLYVHVLRQQEVFELEIAGRGRIRADLY